MSKAAVRQGVDWRVPLPGAGALAVWARNVRVWRKLILSSIVLNFGEPLIYLLGFGYGLGSFVPVMDGVPYLTFLASGVIAFNAMLVSSYEGLYSAFTRMVPQRTYEHLLATPLDVADIVAGEMLWCANKALMSASAILLVAILIGALPWTAFVVLPVVLLTALAFAAPALMMCAVSPSYDFFSYYITLLLTPMMMLCGVFYPTTTFPDWLQSLIQVLPLTHAVELIRPLAMGVPVDNALLHLLVLALWAGVGFYLAVVLARRRLIV